MIVSSFLPLGPTGLAGFSLVKLGKDAIVLIPATSHAQNADFAFVGPGLYGAGIVGAMLLWGLGVRETTFLSVPKLTFSRSGFCSLRWQASFSVGEKACCALIWGQSFL